MPLLINSRPKQDVICRMIKYVDGTSQRLWNISNMIFKKKYITNSKPFYTISVNESVIFTESVIFSSKTDNPTHSPAILHVRTLLYCSRICDSRSFNILSHIMLTCLNVNKGMSLLCGESALKWEFELHWAAWVWTQELSIAGGDGQLSVTDVDCEGWGGLAQPGGNCSCFLLCSRRISIDKFAAICSETRNGKLQIIFM